jgi:uncharacterized protein (TIGR00106 family)
MAIIAISVAPAGIDDIGMSGYVAKALKVLQGDGRVKYEIGPMFTSIEGELNICMEVAMKMHEAIFDAGANRVGTVIKIDDRRDVKASMSGKLASVKASMNSKAV